VRRVRGQQGGRIARGAWSRGAVQVSPGASGAGVPPSPSVSRRTGRRHRRHPSLTPQPRAGLPPGMVAWVVEVFFTRSRVSRVWTVLMPRPSTAVPTRPSASQGCFALFSGTGGWPSSGCPCRRRRMRRVPRRPSAGVRGLRTNARRPAATGGPPRPPSGSASPALPASARSFAITPTAARSPPLRGVRPRLRVRAVNAISGGMIKFDRTLPADDRFRA
jgi:hypothetical protein